MRSFVYAGAATMFAFAMTALGAAAVFFFGGNRSERLERTTLGFAGGVMSAAAVFSLLLPAQERAQALGMLPWAVLCAGTLLGAGMIFLMDMLLARLGPVQRAGRSGARAALLYGAVTLHNIPEGMAVGLAFALAADAGGAALYAACALALGIGLQNIPEGAAVALPLSQCGMGRVRSFALGALSGAAEPVFGLLAALLAVRAAALMPGLMAFSAGAMLMVVFSEMIVKSEDGREGAAAAMLGYVLMMALDVALG
ncbi:MAG: ZIP family metal transporter [Clostridia bacterium]|nr:ZIP family metal transporter [Clostridia bacterium]